jgi:[ribosomal protein S5]-alanine N-acetyltransferase
VTTERLILREPENSDAETLRDYYRRNAERFAPWEPVRPDDLQFHAQWIEAKRAESRRSGQAGVFVAYAKDKPDLVAVVTLEGFTSEDPPGAMLSYTVDGAYEGRGYASEAVERVVRYAFEELGLGALSAYYHPDNARSAKLLERLGFTIVGRTPVIPGFERFMRPQVVAMLRAGAAR